MKKKVMPLVQFGLQRPVGGVSALFGSTSSIICLPIQWQERSWDRSNGTDFPFGPAWYVLNFVYLHAVGVSLVWCDYPNVVT